jgi:hypothetical protein
LKINYQIEANTGVSLSKELQTKINQALAAGESDTVNVPFNEAKGQMRIASSKLCFK